MISFLSLHIWGMKIETQEHLLKQLDLKDVDESLDKKDSHENDSRLFENDTI